MSHASEGMSERLQDYLDGRLDAAEAQAVEERLAADSAWRDELESLRRVNDAVRLGMPSEHESAAPEDFVATVRARIAHEQAAAIRGRWGRILAFSYAAAALVVAGFTAHWMLKDRDTTSPVEQTAKESSEGVDKKQMKDGFKELLPVNGRVNATRKRKGATEAEDKAPAGRWDGDDVLDRETAKPKSREARTGTRSELGGRQAEPADTGAQDGAEGAGDTEKGKAGGFMAPGGAVQPGQRTPSDTPGPRPAATPPPPSTPAPPVAEPARDAAVSPVYELSVRARDTTAARKQIDALLALMRSERSVQDLAADTSVRAQLSSLSLVVERAPTARELAFDKKADAPAAGAKDKSAPSKETLERATGGDAAKKKARARSKPEEAPSEDADDDVERDRSSDARARGRVQPLAGAEDRPAVSRAPSQFDLQARSDLVQRLLRLHALLAETDVGLEAEAPARAPARGATKASVPVRVTVRPLK